MSELAAAFNQALGELLPFSEALDRAEEDRSLSGVVRAEIIAMGWNGMMAPEEAGGLGLGIGEAVELCAVAGQHLLPVALLDESLVLAPALAAVGHPALEGVLDGGLAGGAGYATEGSAALESGALSASGVGVRLSSGARLAALVHPRWTAVVSLEDPAVRLERADALDRSQGVHALSVTGAQPEVVLDGWMDGGGVADLVGGAERMMSLSVSHARVREQFGRPLIRFQAVTHRLAEMKARLELIRSAVARLAFLMEEGAWDRAFLAGLLCVGPRLRPRDMRVCHPGARRNRLHLGIRPPPLLPKNPIPSIHAGRRPQHRRSGWTSLSGHGLALHSLIGDPGAGAGEKRQRN